MNTTFLSHSTCRLKFRIHLERKQKEEEDLEFYENGRKMEFEKGWNGFVENWIRIYQMREDNIKEVWEGGWSEGLRNRYEELQLVPTRSLLPYK